MVKIITDTTACLPKTAAPPPELFAAEFKRLSASGETILCIHPSTNVSGTVRSASVAARDFPGLDIRIIDTRMVASPLATVVRLAVEWSEAGLDKEIVITQLGRSTDGYLSVMHAGVPEQGQELADDLGVTLGLKDIPILDVPPAIVTHGGPGILGVSFFVGK